jgi:lipid II:glycine glycyltransferase (peptidoglycan interpeptide bridge formation enzyme)
LKLIKLNINDKRYLSLITTHGSVFNTTSWLEIFGNNLVLIGITNPNNELIGAFFYVQHFKFALKYALLPPFTPSNGFILINPAQNTSNLITIQKEANDAIANYFLSHNFALVSIGFPVNLVDTQVYFWKKFKVIPNYTYQLDLMKDDIQIFNQFTTERRKSIRKAEKDDLSIQRCLDYEVVLNLVNKTFERKQKSLNQSLIKKIFFEFANETNSFAFVAYQKKIPIATTFIIYYNKVAYYLFGGYDASQKHHGAGPACMWNSIQAAKKLGLKTFDFEGSMLPEVERYFREFGGEIKPYYTINRAWLPIEVALKIKMRNRF